MIGSYLKSLLEKAFYAQGTDFSEPPRAAVDMSKCKKDGTTQWMYCQESKWLYMTQSKERMYKATNDSLMDRGGWPKKKPHLTFFPWKILHWRISYNYTAFPPAFFGHLIIYLPNSKSSVCSLQQCWKYKKEKIIRKDGLPFHQAGEIIVTILIYFLPVFFFYGFSCSWHTTVLSSFCILVWAFSYVIKNLLDHNWLCYSNNTFPL